MFSRRRKRRPTVWLLLTLAVFLSGSVWVKQLIYPLAYQDMIADYARTNGLDPYLVTAIIRVESKFQPKALSARGARGLMQLMPETAQWIAGQMGEPFRPGALFEPDYNIRLGTWYLAELQGEFDHNWVPALAAYNGGRGNVRQWLVGKKWRGDLDTIEQIPFPETREFVRRVVRDYQVYRRWYKRAYMD